MDSNILEKSIIESLALGELNEEAKVSLDLLIDKICLRLEFINEEVENEVKDNIREDLYKHWHNYNPERGTKSWIYYSQIINSSIIRIINESSKNKQ